LFSHFIHRKRTNLFANLRGFSSIIGAIFAILMIFSLVSTVFVWTLSQNANYENSMAQNRQLDLDRSKENIIANVTCSRVNNSTVSVTGVLQNGGSLSSQVITVWVVDNNTKTYASKNPPNILSLKSGDVTTLSGSTAINVSLPNSLEDSLSCWFTTARGNTITINPFFAAQNNAIAPFAYVAGGIGSLAFTFESFTYFTVNNGKLTPYPTGTQAYTIPAGSNMAFGFNITNYNINKYNVTLDSKSIMWSYFAAVPGHTLGPVWYIVNNQTDTIQTPYSPITLQYNVTKFLVFAQQSQTFDQQHHNSIAAVNLLFFGNYTTTSGGSTVVRSNYGQNIPFVALYFSP